MTVGVVARSTNAQLPPPLPPAAVVVALTPVALMAVPFPPEPPPGGQLYCGTRAVHAEHVALRELYGQDPPSPIRKMGRTMQRMLMRVTTVMTKGKTQPPLPPPAPTRYQGR